MNNTTKWLVNAAALAVIALGLKAAAPLVTQVLIILFLAIIISPAYYLLRRLRLPPWLALTALILTISLASLYTVGYAAPRAAFKYGKDIPEYVDKLAATAERTRAWLKENDVVVPEPFYAEIMRLDPAMASSYVKQTGAVMADFFKSAVFVLIIVCFILCELPNLPAHAKKLSWMTDDLWERLSSIAVDVRRYLGIKTAVSAFTGLLVYIGLSAMGIHSALPLGLIAFALNFVPFIGSIIAAAPAVMIALMQRDAVFGFYTALLYLAVNMALGNVLEPKLMGRGFGVSPVLVLASLIFWGWVLGPLGMFFAVPLTMAGRAAIVSLAEEDGARGAW